MGRIVMRVAEREAARRILAPLTPIPIFQMTHRKHYTKIPLQGNVYPMTCAVYIEDESRRVTILSAQSLGVMAGSRPGEIKIWLERKMSQDDERGMAEAMTDVKPSRSIFKVLLEEISKPQGENNVVRSLSLVTLVDVDLKSAKHA